MIYSRVFKSKLLGCRLPNRSQIRFQERPSRSLDQPPMTTTNSSFITADSQPQSAVVASNRHHAAVLHRFTRRMTALEAGRRLWGFAKQLVTFVTTYLLLSLSVLVFLSSVKRCFLLAPPTLVDNKTTRTPGLPINHSTGSISMGQTAIVSHAESFAALLMHLR